MLKTIIIIIIVTANFNFANLDMLPMATARASGKHSNFRKSRQKYHKRRFY